jgi:hypothetical protein
MNFVTAGERIVTPDKSLTKMDLAAANRVPGVALPRPW